MAISPLKPEEIAFEHPYVLVARNMVQRTMTRKCNDRIASCVARNRRLGLLVFTLAAALAACAPKASGPPPAPLVIGGWQPADPSGDGVQAAASYAAAHLPQQHGTLVEVVSVQTQVVAGTNLRMALRMADGTRWSVTVWHKLDGSFELTDAQQVP
jgi:hypothetical protein